MKIKVFLMISTLLLLLSSSLTLAKPLYQATGGTVTYSGAYTIHTFNANDTFTPNSNLAIDILVVGGGGAGGWGAGGGGGGGGEVKISSLNLIANTAYTVAVGLGGTGVSSAIAAGKGQNSGFSTLIAAQGGGYGASYGLSGGNGGNGGGGNITTAAGTGTQFNGGAGYIGGDSVLGGGGGGGAAAIGSNAASGKAGDGGVGISSSISGSAATYGSGGGGGTNGATVGSGASGAGNGKTAAAGQAGNGTDGTGGGGGGSGSGGTSGNGGRGVVIIRYLTSNLGPCGDTTQCLATVIAQNNILISKSVSINNYKSFSGTFATQGGYYQVDMKADAGDVIMSVILLAQFFVLVFYVRNRYARGGRVS